MSETHNDGMFPTWCGDVVRSLLEQVPAGMCRVEIRPPVEVHLPVAQQVTLLQQNARVADCNQRLALMLGSASPAELAGYRLGEVFLRDDPLQEKRLEAFVRAGYQLSNLESRVQDPTGNLRLFLYNLTGVLEDGRLTRIWGSVRDVTDLRRTEADNLRLAALTRENPNPVIETDAAGFVTTMNTAVRALLQTLQLDLADLLPPNHVDLVRACLESGQPIHEVEVAIRSRFLAWTYFPVLALGVVHLYALEITDRKRNEQILQHDALHDALTGLPNRALLHDRLERALQRAVRHSDYLFAVLFVDLDRFKTVNDSLGHLAGDQLLTAVAGRLQQCARRQDTVARVGGDEFVILQDDLRGVADATRLAERIQESLASPIPVSAQEVHTSASIGIALSSAGYARPEDLLRNADTAMYRAKTGGSGRFEVFDKAMHERAVAQQRLELDLRFALERNQLLVYYQPIVQATTSRVVSFEALVRWQHPTRGLISPAEFIPLAEETGLIDPIARWVLEHVCRQNRAWREAGRPRVRISVNLSGRQIVQPTLAEGIQRILADTSLEPSALELEITESVAAKDPNQAVKTLEELRAAGIHVLIDDFGTGYSSLSQLKRFPIDGVKIDQSFIRDLGKDPAAAPMVTAVVSMAHALGFEVVAEGVETAEQLTFVRARGCDYLQGFFFARPAPVAEVERAWLKRE